MGSRHFQLIVLFISCLALSAADNGVDGISDACLYCIKRVQPSQNETCITHPTQPNILRCGAFKMSEAFYLDCRTYMQSLPEAWDNWQKCYSDDECGQECVRVYHNHYESTCAAFKDNPSETLTCADYGQIHYGGALSCGNPEDAATDFITNMTLLCGCETVTGNRSECLNQEVRSQCVQEIPRQMFVGVVVGVGCGAIVLILLTIVISIYCNYKKSQAVITQNEKKAIVPQKFKNKQFTANYPKAAATTTSESVQKSLMAMAATTSEISPVSTLADRHNYQHQSPLPTVPSAEPSVGSLTGSDNKGSNVGGNSVHNNELSIMIDPSPQNYEKGYINMPSGMTLDRGPGSSVSSSQSVDKVRAPIPVPR